MGIGVERVRQIQSVARCFRCPQERRGDQAGWHFFDVTDRRLRVQMRVHVCPLHYAQFAGAERARWTPLEKPALPGVVGPIPAREDTRGST